MLIWGHSTNQVQKKLGVNRDVLLWWSRRWLEEANLKRRAPGRPMITTKSSNRTSVVQTKPGLFVDFTGVVQKVWTCSVLNAYLLPSWCRQSEFLPKWVSLIIQDANTSRGDLDSSYRLRWWRNFTIAILITSFVSIWSRLGSVGSNTLSHQTQRIVLSPSLNAGIC